ncbi:MAG TPA: glycosyltransferase family 39 protein [Verrucomicrobiaceae bacterium]
MNRQRFLPHALAVLTLARFCLLPLTELSPVEAHAALCSERAELWHSLAGPVLPLCMRLSSAVFGMNEFGLRFFAPILMLVAGWLVWKMAHGLFDATTAAWATVLFQVSPVVNLSAVNFTNTTLGIVEGSALLLLLRLALHQPPRHQLHWWAVSAMTLVAFFTDWRLILFTVAGTGSLFLTRRGRAAIMKWPVLPILAGPLALALLIFLAWNSERGWVAFQFPVADVPALVALGRCGLLAYGPPLALLLGWSLLDSTWQRPLLYAPAFLLAFAWPLISLDLFAVHSTQWPQVGFAAWLPAVVVLAAARLMQNDRLTVRAKLWIRSLVMLAAAFQSCLILQPSLLRTLKVFACSPAPAADKSK